MLIIAKRLRDLSFPKLTEVYRESLRKRGKELAEGEEEDLQLRIAEDDFYDYLLTSFFRQDNSLCAIWCEQYRYCSVLRLEPYEDGLLLEGLETAPDLREKGYAFALINAVQMCLSEEGRSVKLYSHVQNNNHASIAVHKACGFYLIRDYAAYVDGSVDSRASTWIWENIF